MTSLWLLFTGIGFWIGGLATAGYLGSVKFSILKKYDKDQRFSRVNVFGVVNVDWRSKEIPKVLINEWKSRGIPRLDSICVAIMVISSGN
jgi:hypothetical protein